jgi:hypothetical protein
MHRWTPKSTDAYRTAAVVVDEAFASHILGTRY